MDEFDEIVREFLVESYENLDQLDRDLVALEQEPDAHPLLQSIFRTIHTIKGTSGFLAFGKLEVLTHAGEGLLSRLRDGGLRLTQERTTGLLRTRRRRPRHPGLDRGHRRRGRPRLHRPGRAARPTFADPGRRRDGRFVASGAAPRPAVDSTRGGAAQRRRAEPAAVVSSPAAAVRRRRPPPIHRRARRGGAAGRPIARRQPATTAHKRRRRPPRGPRPKVALKHGIKAARRRTQGEPGCARSCSPRARRRDVPLLGELLRKQADIDAEDVAVAMLEQQLGDDRPLGEILVDHGQATPDQVREALAFQAAAQAEARVGGSVSDSTLRVDVDLLDTLMRLVGELVLTRNQIVATAAARGRHRRCMRSSQRLNLWSASCRRAS